MKNYRQFLYYFIFLAFSVVLLIPIPFFDSLFSSDKRLELFIEYFSPVGDGFIKVVELLTFLFFISIVIVSIKHIVKHKKYKLVFTHSFITSISLFIIFSFFVFFLLFFLNNFDIIPSLNSLNKETISSLDSNEIIDLSTYLSNDSGFFKNINKDFPVIHKLTDFLFEIIPDNIFTAISNQRYFSLFLVVVLITMAIFSVRSYYSTSYFFSFFFFLFSVLTRLFRFFYKVLPIAFLPIIAFFLSYYISYLKVSFAVFNTIISYKILFFAMPIFLLAFVLFFAHLFLFKKRNFLNSIFMYFEILFLSFIPHFSLVSVFRLIPYFSSLSLAHRKAVLFPLMFESVTFNYGKFFTFSILIFVSLKFYLIDVSDKYLLIIFASALCSFFPFYFSSIQLPLLFFCLSYVFNLHHTSTLLFLIPLFIIFQPLSTLLNNATLLFKNTLLSLYLSKRYIPSYHRITLEDKATIFSKAPISIMKPSYNIPFRWISFNIYFFVLVYSLLITFIFYRSSLVEKELSIKDSTVSHKRIIRHVSKSISSRIRDSFDLIYSKVSQLVDNRLINRPLDYSLDEYIGYLYKNLLIKNELVRYVSVSYANGHTYLLKRVPRGSLNLLNANFRKHNIIKVNKFNRSEDITLNDDDVVYIHRKESFRNNVCNNDSALNLNNAYWSKPHWFPLEFQSGIVVCGRVSIDSRVKAYIRVGTRLEDISSVLRRELPDNFNGYIFDSYSQLIATSYKYPVWRRKKINGIDGISLIHIKDYQEKILNDFHIDYIGAKTSIYENQKNNDISFINSFKIYPNIFWNIGVISNLDTNAIKDPSNYVAVLLSALLLIILIWVISSIFNRIDNSFNYIDGEITKIKQMNFSASKNMDNIFEIREIDFINKAFTDVKKIFRIVKRYIPSSLLSHITKLESSQVKLGGVKRSLTILFTDIANFTNISEKHSLSELLQNLSIYFTHADNIISSNQGTIDKYIGDAIMSFWGAPDKIDNQAYKACISAIECQEKFLEINSSALTIPFSTRFGLHSDTVIVGNIGSLNRLNYTVIGDGVNLASRIEGLNKIYATSIIMSNSVKEQVDNKLEYRLLDKVAVKGKEKGTKIYQVLGRKGEYSFLNYDDGLLSKMQMEGFLAFYEDALYHYFNGNFQDSILSINKAQKIYNKDVAINLILDRCNFLIKKPPGNDWDGVYHLDHK